MKLPKFGALLKDSANKRALNFLVVATIFCMAFLVGSPFLVNSSQQRLSSRWGTPEFLQRSSLCKNQCKPHGSEPLPKGIISRMSNLELRPIQGSPHFSKRKKAVKASKSLLAMAVGIRQKKIVDQIIQKFIASDFCIMLFHYDGTVDEWRDSEWSGDIIHVSAINQTKWWFAKRFLHPDIVAEYNYIFLWDEDLGVEHFHPGRYVSIVEKEGLEISQPALNTAASEVHHQITARGRKGDVHRRIYKLRGRGRCYKNSTAPPCTGWVEMMAPVFSRAAWQCVWHMIQNDLIHAWGLDMKLGYCAQGERTKNIGVVDAEYIVHMGIPTLGSLDENKSNVETAEHSSESESSYSTKIVPPGSSSSTGRSAIRHRSYAELVIFEQRWKSAVAKDECWNDPFAEPTKKISV